VTDILAVSVILVIEIILVIVTVSFV